MLDEEIKTLKAECKAIAAALNRLHKANEVLQHEIALAKRRAREKKQ